MGDPLLAISRLREARASLDPMGFDPDKTATKEPRNRCSNCKKLNNSIRNWCGFCGFKL